MQHHIDDIVVRGCTCAITYRELDVCDLTFRSTLGSIHDPCASAVHAAREVAVISSK
jgi:hypothetical protein